ncbi:hypothetical protein [Bradyrhizobium sp. dw_78]|uniref:hypothetical protein n=1 Tax=Bradyrhizobium sp. dw_78 TaxID=2719793 RepID=UPI001BD4BF05|nr:hypothetical protein [Bradyrhizobium sp. dw_78]
MKRLHPFTLIKMNERLPYRPVMTAPDLKRGIAIVVTVKIILLVAAAVFVFGPHQRPQIDRNAVDRQILNNSNSQEPIP